MTYDRKILINSIQYLCKHFPCVVILGARQVGKTTLMKELFPGAPFFDLEKESDYQRIQRDPEFFLSQQNSNALPLLMDEAQLMPELFSALRVYIDENRQKNGQVILSGSSSPELLKQITESLAGRAAIFEVSALHLDEINPIPSPSFFDVLSKMDAKTLLELEPPPSKEPMWDRFFYGGYPEAFSKRSDEKFFDLWMENYFKTYIERDIRRLFSDLNITAFKTFISMLAQASGTLINVSEFARSLGVSAPTAKNYFRIAEGTFIWRNLESFESDPTKRVSKMSRGYLRDSGLLCHLLKLRDRPSLLSHPLVGRFWESFISEQIIVGLESRLVGAEYFHYRTRNHAEIDLIVSGKFGLLPIEIKLGTQVDKKKLLSLQTFVKENKLEFGLLINNSETVQWILPKVLQIPAHYL